MHGLYYYKQNNDHTNLWMKIILSCGMMTIPFLVWLSMVWFSYHFWYAQCKQWNHTYFGMKFIPLFLLSFLKLDSLLIGLTSNQSKVSPVSESSAKTTVWISYQNRYDFTVYTGHTKNGMKIIPWIIIPKTVWSSYHKIVWFSSINWCDRYSAYSSIIHAWYTFSFFLLLNDINVAKQITRHIKEMHWHKKQ